MDLQRLKTKKIGVLMGGLSGEREISLRSGDNCLRALLAKGYDAVAVDAVQDVAQRLDELEIEVAFLALHGRYGEDGTIQGLLEIMGIPYTGSRVLASALGMNKIAAKKVAIASGVRSPEYYEVGLAEPSVAAASSIVGMLGLPVMLKPVEEGSSLGVVKCDDSGSLAASIDLSRKEFGSVFAERFVSGREITAAVLQHEGEVKVLPILELVPKNAFYDYEAKYTKGLTDFVLPANLSAATYAESEDLARASFDAIGCSGYARVDMMVDAEGSPWFIEVNTLPGMTDTSDLPAQAEAAGISYEDLVETILLTAVA